MDPRYAERWSHIKNTKVSQYIQRSFFINMSIMSTELLDLQLSFRALSDEEDVDGVENDDATDLEDDDDLEDLDEDGADKKDDDDDEEEPVEE